MLGLATQQLYRYRYTELYCRWENCAVFLCVYYTNMGSIIQIYMGVLTGESRRP